MYASNPVTLCPRCRAPVVATARFCSECGTWVVHEPVPPPLQDSPAAYIATLPASELTMQSPPPSVALRPSGPGATQIKTAHKTAGEGFTDVDRKRLVTPGPTPTPFGPVRTTESGYERFTAVDKSVPHVTPTPSRADEVAPMSRASRTVVDDSPSRTPSRSTGRTARPLGGFLVSYQYEPLGTFWPLGQGPNLVGRAGARPDIDVGISDATVSSEQASIDVESTGISVLDRGSTNGTFINGRQLPSGGKAMVGHGDRLRFGSFETIVVVVPYPATS